MVPFAEMLAFSSARLPHACHTYTTSQTYYNFDPKPEAHAKEVSPFVQIILDSFLYNPLDTFFTGSLKIPQDKLEALLKHLHTSGQHHLALLFAPIPATAEHSWTWLSGPAIAFRGLGIQPHAVEPIRGVHRVGAEGGQSETLRGAENPC
jgi:hypothetical protein